MTKHKSKQQLGSVHRRDRESIRQNSLRQGTNSAEHEEVVPFVENGTVFSDDSPSTDQEVELRIPIYEEKSSIRNDESSGTSTIDQETPLTWEEYHAKWDRFDAEGKKIYGLRPVPLTDEEITERSHPLLGRMINAVAADKESGGYNCQLDKALAGGAITFDEFYEALLEGIARADASSFERFKGKER